MNLNMYKMSMQQTRKSFIVWLVTIPLLVVLGMAFYPAISSSLGDLVGLFENPMMKGILGLFAMGPDQLNSLPGFYITYASIYVILMGGMFAAMTVISDLGNELRDKTTEFLLTRPVTRRAVVLTKWSAAVSRILILTLVLFSVTLLSFSVISSQAALIYFENDKALDEVQEIVLKQPSGIQSVWTLDDDFFTGWTMQVITQTMESSPEAMQEIDIDRASLADLMEKLEEDPNKLFEELLNEPAKYMEMFGVTESEEDTFKMAIEERKAEFEEIQKRYLNDAGFHGEMFTLSPEYFMRSIKSIEGRDRFVSHYPEAESSIRKLLAPYDTIRLAKLHVYIFLFMTAIASIATALTVGLRQAKNATSVGIGVVLVLYFVSTLLKISPITAAWTWISPFGLIDQGLTGGSYVMNPFNVGLLVLETGVFLTLAIYLFEKKDLQS